MPNTPAPALAAVPDTGTYQKINNIVGAPTVLTAAIEQFKTQRAAARTTLTSALANDLAAASLDVEGAIVKENAWKKNDEALAAKIKAAEDLKEIFENQIEDLKKTQPEVLRTVLQTKIDELEAELRVDHEQTELVRDQIKFLRSVLHEVNGSTKKPS